MLFLLAGDCILCYLSAVVLQTCSACSSWLSGRGMKSWLLQAGCLPFDPYLHVEREMRRWGAVGKAAAGRLFSSSHVFCGWICCVTCLCHVDLECFPQHVMLCRCCKFLLLTDFTPASCLSGTPLKIVRISYTQLFSNYKRGELLFIAQGPASNRTLNSH